MDTGNTQERFEIAMQNNFIINYANLIADNVASYYAIYGNDNIMPLRFIKRMSKDDYSNSEEYEKLNYLIEEALRNRHNLKLISGYEDDKLTLEELK